MTILGVVLLISIGVVVYINQPNFGKMPQGERLERLKNRQTTEMIRSKT